MPMSTRPLVAALALLASDVFASDAAPALPGHVKAAAPPAPPLSPEAALTAFRVAPGYAVELVAAEPLVEAPVAIAFDANGRLWAVEMRGYMPNVDGDGEDQPSGRVVVLEDADGDGRMDRRTVFLEGLVLPRSIAFGGGGVLVAAPPELLFCRDVEKLLAAGKPCERPEVVASDYGTRKNPEHDANGLVPAMDNWLYSANHGVRYRWADGRWQSAPTVRRGQWGIAQDDVGRLVFNNNSDYLRGDLLPVFDRRAHLRGTRGVNVQLDKDQSTWPGRATLGVNRGYRSGTLREDGTLAKFTAACGPHVYRGGAFPEDARGDAFIAEPSANFVRRARLTHAGEPQAPLVSAKNAYEKAEFLTSTDERFRPVNLATGPDGALYVVDMYRGLIQHRIYLTPFLKEQIRARGLDRPLHQGRIWRVVAAGQPRAARPSLARASTTALARTLEHPNGWWRDTAQRLMVERGPRVAAAAVGVFRRAKDPRARLHAMFVLEGVGRVDEAVLRRAEGDGDAWVRAAARGLREAREALALGQLAGRLAARPQLSRTMERQLAGRELALLEQVVSSPAWSEPGDGRKDLLVALAARATRDGNPERLQRLLELVATEPRARAWRQVALLDGVLAGRRGERAPTQTTPNGWSKLLRTENEAVRSRATTVDAWVRGSSGPRGPEKTASRTLNENDQSRVARGKALYPGVCGACHHPSGTGEEGKAPPLVDSEWVLGSAERLVRITLQGLRGPIKVGEKIYEMEMPAMGALADADLADLLTYVRTEKEWGHDAAPIDAGTVARIRKATAAREEPWTAEELAKLK